jgi:hypothetical protein
MNPTFLTTIVLLFIHLCLFSPNSSAQSEKGQKGAIDKKTMLSIFEAGRDDPEKGWVDGYVVDGNDVIEIIRDTNLTICIRNSIINRGLNFTLITSTPLEKITKPSEWNEKEWNEWITNKKSKNIKSAICIHAEINIISCEILPINSQKWSILAFSYPDTLIIFFRYCNFKHSLFSKDVCFEHATFSDGASFIVTKYEGEVDFSNIVFRYGVDLSASKFLRKAVFKHSNFVKGGFFSHVEFARDANFNRANFGGNSSFINTQFMGITDFNNSNFIEGVNFGASRFSDIAEFHGSRIGGIARFSGVRFNKNTVFTSSVFTKDIDFNGATFEGNAYFDRSIFIGSSDFSNSTFIGEAILSDAHFDGKVIISNARFDKIAFFKNSQFTNLLSLNIAAFGQYADFRDTQIEQLSWDCSKNPTFVESQVDFRNTTISEAHFEDLIFNKDVDFSDATLKAVAFRFVTFASNAYFIGTRFQGNTALERVKFKHEANFTDSDFRSSGNGVGKRFEMSHVTLGNLTLNWNQLPNQQAWVLSPSERNKGSSG